jgi:hypothetical protein
MRPSTACRLVLAATLAGCTNHGTTNVVSGEVHALPTGAAAAVLGRAPYSEPWSSVKIVGGSPQQRQALRRIVRGFRWTAIRTIKITTPRVRHHGSDFSYIIAVPAQATKQGTLSSQGTWQAAMVGESYAAIRSAHQLPRLRRQDFSDLLPDGKVVGLFGGSGTDYGGHLGTLPSIRTETTRARQAAAQAGFQVRYVGFVRPTATLPVIFVTTAGHDHIRQRLDSFLAGVVPTPNANLAYIQLDTRCGRPIFARGEGISIDRHWFSICDFAAACPPLDEGSHPAKLTYPC